MVSLLRARAPAHSPQRCVGLLPCCQNPGYHNTLGDCCCPWCLLGNFTAGRTLTAHVVVVVLLLLLWVEANEDGHAREARHAAPVTEAAAGLSPLPYREMAPCLPPIPYHLSLASDRRELRSIDLGTL